MSFVIYPLICAAAAGIILVAARLLRLRYSLRSLAIFVLLAGCCEALYINWGPWREERVFRRDKNGAFSASSSQPTEDPNGISALAFNADGSQLAMRSTSGECQLGRIGDSSFKVLSAESSGWCEGLAFNPSGNMLASGVSLWSACVWDSRTGVPIRLFDILQERAPSAGSNADHIEWLSETEFVTWDPTSTSSVNICSVQGETRVREIHSAKSLFYRVAPSPDGGTLAAAGIDGSLSVFDAASGTCRVTFKAHRGAIMAATFSHDGAILATGGNDCTIRVWNTKDWSLSTTLVADAPIRDLSFTPNDKVLASANGFADMWRTTDRSRLATLRGHEGRISGALAFPDSRRFLTVGAAEAPRIWDVGGRCLAILRAAGLQRQSTYHRPRGVSAVALSRTGGLVAVGRYEGDITLWRRHRPEWWWGIFYMLEFWFSAGFAVALVWSLLADRRAFARMDAEAARGKAAS